MIIWFPFQIQVMLVILFHRDNAHNVNTDYYSLSLQVGHKIVKTKMKTMHSTFSTLQFPSTNILIAECKHYILLNLLCPWKHSYTVFSLVKEGITWEISKYNLTKLLLQQSGTANLLHFRDEVQSGKCSERCYCPLVFKETWVMMILTVNWL